MVYGIYSRGANTLSFALGGPCSTLLSQLFQLSTIIVFLQTFLHFVLIVKLIDAWLHFFVSHRFRTMFLISPYRLIHPLLLQLNLSLLHFSCHIQLLIYYIIAFDSERLCINSGCSPSSSYPDRINSLVSRCNVSFK